MPNLRVVAVAGLALALFHGPALAQTAPGFVFGRDVRVSTGVLYEHWDEDRLGPLGEPLDQATVYLTAGVPVSSKAGLRLVSGWASSDWPTVGNISGLRDTQLDATYKANRQLGFRLGLNLPTGQSALTLDQYLVSRGLSSRLKGYRTNELGMGFNVLLATGYTIPLGPLVGGIGASYLYYGSFQLLVDDVDYKPGDEATLGLTLDRNFGTLLLRNSFLLRLYSSDELDNASVLKLGPRYELQSLLSSRGRAPWLIRVKLILPGDVTITALDGEFSDTVNRGLEFYTDGTLDYPISTSWVLQGLGGFRIFGSNEGGVGDGSRIDLGAGARLRVSRQIWLSGLGRLSTGSIDLGLGDSSTSLNGYALELGLQYRRP